MKRFSIGSRTYVPRTLYERVSYPSLLPPGSVRAHFNPEVGHTTKICANLNPNPCTLIAKDGWIYPANPRCPRIRSLVRGEDDPIVTAES